MESLTEDEIVEERMEHLEARFYKACPAVKAAQYLGERALALIQVDEILDQWLSLRDRDEK